MTSQRERTWIAVVILIIGLLWLASRTVSGQVVGPRPAVRFTQTDLVILHNGTEVWLLHDHAANEVCWIVVEGPGITMTPRVC